MHLIILSYSSYIPRSFFIFNCSLILLLHSRILFYIQLFSHTPPTLPILFYIQLFSHTPPTLPDPFLYSTVLPYSSYITGSFLYSTVLLLLHSRILFYILLFYSSYIPGSFFIFNCYLKLILHIRIP